MACRAGGRLPEPAPGKVNVVRVQPAWCTAGNLTAVRTRRAAPSSGTECTTERFDTSERAAAVEWGQHRRPCTWPAGQVAPGPRRANEKIRKVMPGGCGSCRPPPRAPDSSAFLGQATIIPSGPCLPPDT